MRQEIFEKMILPKVGITSMGIIMFTNKQTNRWTIA